MERRFFYHAFGAGLGGRITRPCCEVIDAQAPAVLPTVGGYASGRVDGYRFKDIVSVASARTLAVGSQMNDGSFHTSITVTVEGLNILDVITADSITARVASRHKDGSDPLITAVGTEFRGLRIGGELIDVAVPDPDLHFTELTPEDFTKRAKAIEAKARPNASSTPGSSGFLFGEKTGGTMCSIVKPTSFQHDIPTVGKVFLGEVLGLGYARRLTMVRVQLGSPVEGDIEFASGEINGFTYP